MTGKSRIILVHHAALITNASVRPSVRLSVHPCERRFAVRFAVYREKGKGEGERERARKKGEGDITPIGLTD